MTNNWFALFVYFSSLSEGGGRDVRLRNMQNYPRESLEHEVLEIKGEGRVEGIKIRDLKGKQEKEFDVGGVFIEIGLIPNSGVVKGVTTLNRLGEVEVNCANETGVPGLFAAGDVTNVPEKQIVVAAGEGAKAALQAHRYIQRLK